MFNKLIPISLFLVAFFCFFISSFQTTQASYTLEGEAFYAYKSNQGGSSYKLEGTAFYSYQESYGDSKPIFKFYNKTTGDYLYTISENEKNFITSNLSFWWNYEGIVFNAFKYQVESSKPVYRFYNKISDQHLYTVSENEKNFINSNLSYWWNYEGVAFHAFNYQIENSEPVYRFYDKTKDQYQYATNQEEFDQLSASSQYPTLPVYRFYNQTNGDHFYTINEADKNLFINTPNFGYKYEGVAFYAYPKKQEGTDAVYRFYNKFTGDHLYTISSTEKNKLETELSYWWNYEGIAFYAFKGQFSGTYPVYRLFNNNDHFYTISEEDKNYLVSLGNGPKISIGLWYYDKTGIQDSPFRIDANKPYNIKDKNGNVLAQIGADNTTEVTYESDGKLKVSGSISSILVDSSVTFDAADGDNLSLIFDAHRPDSSFDEYRGKITVKYYKGNNIINGTTETVTQIWVINTLPLEHYVWGMGETTGTGDIEHTKVMTTIFRTYGKWYIEYATKYLPLGFKIRSDSGSQIYYGYNWETGHPNITKAAKATRGAIATYGSEIALTPYSSWTDGRTRSFKERWGSDDYPWCKSVSDPYGKHPSLSTSQLEASGNHMVGMSANGSVVLARDHDWDYQRILKYYYTGISLAPLY